VRIFPCAWRPLRALLVPRTNVRTASFAHVGASTMPSAKLLCRSIRKRAFRGEGGEDGGARKRRLPIRLPSAYGGRLRPGHCRPPQHQNCLATYGVTVGRRLGFRARERFACDMVALVVLSWWAGRKTLA